MLRKRDRAKRVFALVHYMDVHSDYLSLPKYEKIFVRPYDGFADGTTQQLYRFAAGKFDLNRGCRAPAGSVRRRDSADRRPAGPPVRVPRRRGTVRRERAGRDVGPRGGIPGARQRVARSHPVPGGRSRPLDLPWTRRARRQARLDSRLADRRHADKPGTARAAGSGRPRRRFRQRAVAPTGGQVDRPLALLRGRRGLPSAGARRRSGRAFRAVRDDRFKLHLDIDTGNVGLFDLSGDPGETVNVIADHPDAGKRLWVELRQFLGDDE